jgi:hypothetical protein
MEMLAERMKREGLSQAVDLMTKRNPATFPGLES